MNTDTSTPAAGYLALVAILAAGAVIWLVVSPPAISSAALISLLALGIVIASGYLGASVARARRHRHDA